MDPPEQIVKAEPVEQDKVMQNLQALSVQGAVAPFLDPEQESADSTYVDPEEGFEEEANLDGDDPEVQPDGYWISPTRYVQFATRVESESSREDVQRAEEVDQDQELADGLPAENEKKVGQNSELADASPDNDEEVPRVLAETAAALEVGAMDSGDLRRQQLTMRSSEQQKREEAKEGKKKEKEVQKKAEAKPKGRPKKLQVEDKKVEETAQPPDASKRLRKRQKSAPDLADQGLAVEKPAQEAAPKKKPCKTRSTAKAHRGSAEVDGHGHGPEVPEGGDVEPAQNVAAEVEVAAGSFEPEVPAAEAVPTKKKRKKGLRKKPVELEPEVEKAAGSTKKKRKQSESEKPVELAPEVEKAARSRKKRKKSQSKPVEPEPEVEKAAGSAEVVAEAPPKKKKKGKKTQYQEKAEKEPHVAGDDKEKKRKAKTGGRAGADPPGTVDEDMKKEMVALLEKWRGKEYDRNEETYHSSDEFGDSIAFTVYWNRPAVGIKIWDYEEKEWAQKAYFAKYSLTLCIFMARKFALQLFQKGLDWGTKDEGIAYRNDLKATAAAAEAALLRL